LTFVNEPRPGLVTVRWSVSREVEKMSEIPDLAISAEKVAAILAKARQFDVKDVVTDPNPGSNASDDAMFSASSSFSRLRGFLPMPKS
jgi:hypothetical protein